MFSVDREDKQKLIDCYDDPQELLHIISVNLLTLAKVQADDYLMTTGDLFAIQRPSDYRLIPIGVFRFYYGYSRQITLDNIKQLYDSAKYLLEKVQLTEEERKKVRVRLQNPRLRPGWQNWQGRFNLLFQEDHGNGER